MLQQIAIFILSAGLAVLCVGVIAAFILCVLWLEYVLTGGSK